jgi:hypothetical protein
MTEETKMILEILKLCISLLTPILVLAAGLLISRKLEKNKLEVLKEKEWQVKWAELFFKQAIIFSENVSTIIFSLHSLQNEENKSERDKFEGTIKTSFKKLKEIDWDVQNYAQFSENYGQAMTLSQKKLLGSIGELISKGQGDLEKFRKQQFEYNDFVRKAHSEILKMK